MTRDELRAAWIAALRSGDYRQDVGHLRTEHGYCCLGVLCEVAGIPAAPYPQRGFYTYDGEDVFLPEPLRAAVGLVSCGGDFEDPDLTSLAEMNDSGSSFLEIADALESGAYWEVDA